MSEDDRDNVVQAVEGSIEGSGAFMPLGPRFVRPRPLIGDTLDLMRRRAILGLVCAVTMLGCGGTDGGTTSFTTTPFMPTTAVGSESETVAEGDGSTASPDSSSGSVATSTDDGSSESATSSVDDSTSGSTGPDPGPELDPPAGGSSGGAGGGAAGGDVRMTPTGITYRIIAPGGAGPLPAMIVYSGTEGGATMTNNLGGLGGPTGNSGTVFAVLDGVTYNGNGQAGADVLDHIRTQYDIDNDRTYLLSESAGTSAGLQLGLQLRQSYFAAYWANDVNTNLTPSMDASDLGFAPYGNAGPGGAFADANAIVDGMDAAGYRTPEPSPYDGPGADQHGSVDQFIAALEWFPGKTRQ